MKFSQASTQFQGVRNFAVGHSLENACQGCSELYRLQMWASADSFRVLISLM